MTEKRTFKKSSMRLAIHYCLFNDCFKAIKIFKVCNQHELFLLALKSCRTSSVGNLTSLEKMHNICTFMASPLEMYGETFGVPITKLSNI